jgi:hypothetical protein
MEGDGILAVAQAPCTEQGGRIEDGNVDPLDIHIFELDCGIAVPSAVLPPDTPVDEAASPEWPASKPSVHVAAQSLAPVHVLMDVTIAVNHKVPVAHAALRWSWSQAPTRVPQECCLKDGICAPHDRQSSA